ncbi:MAG: hypothetical protein NZ840_07815 [Anaerolineales bacterium]|nr:hypothetical protein [Anaerolineales bacterium]MDW8161945.1 hypothetical protein [Anaerolineales bacterium]
MSQQWVSFLGVLLAVGAALYNLISSDWRWRMLALGVQGIGFFLLCFQSLSLGLSLVKFIESWTAVAIIGTALANTARNPARGRSVERETSGPFHFPFSARAFRLAMAVLIGIALPQAVWHLMSLFGGLGFFHAIAALALSSISLLILSFRTSTLSIAIGLLTFFQGFEILFAAIEPSLMLTGLLAAIVLSTAFLCAYFLRVEEERQAR